MNCVEFEHLLNAAEADHSHDRLNDSGLLAHAVICADCQQKLDAARVLADAISAWKSAPPQIDVTDAVLAAWRNTPSAVPARPVRVESFPQSATMVPHTASAFPGRSKFSSLRAARNSLLSMFSGLAALALLAIIWDSPQDADTPRSAVSSPRVENPEASATGQPAPELDSHPQPPVDALVRTAGHAWLALAQRAGSDVRDAAQLVIPQSASSPADTSTDFLGGVERQLQPWQDRLGNTFGQWLDQGS